jgi:hypothetical protein
VSDQPHPSVDQFGYIKTYKSSVFLQAFSKGMSNFVIVFSSCCIPCAGLSVLEVTRIPAADYAGVYISTSIYVDCECYDIKDYLCNR